MSIQLGKVMRESLKADCSKCFGLCCVALNITATSDFAIDKPAGTPCPHLQGDFRCGIHNDLRAKGFKGCTVFDCLGAGQKVAQDTFGGKSWREHPDIADKMFRVFPIMEQLYEMIAFITEALTYRTAPSLQEKLSKQLKELQDLTELDADHLLELDMICCRGPVNELLLETSQLIRNKLHSKGKEYRGMDLIGKNFRGKDLRASDFRGAYLIASDLRHTDLRGADFIGADLRDADLSGANLSTSLFLTQMQINSAKGDHNTILPTHIEQPSHWIK